MRSILAFLCLLFVAGCSGDPSSFGITGPGAVQPQPIRPPSETPDAQPTPGVNITGPMYGPSIVPSTGNSGFWGYN